MKIIITTFLLLSSFFVNAQFLKVSYSLVRSTTISNNENFSPEMKNKVAESEKIPEKYTLFLAHGNSYFISLPRKIVSNESDTSKGNSVYSHIETSIVEPIKTYRINGDDKNYSYHNVDGYEFYQYDSLKSKAINYKQDTQKIENYLCKLVEVTNFNNNVTKVWYTEEVPVSAGPFFFNSFPGLVLKIEAPTFVMYATEVSNNGIESDVRTIDKKLPIFSGAAYTKKMKELNDKKQNNQNKVIKL